MFEGVLLALEGVMPAFDGVLLTFDGALLTFDGALLVFEAARTTVEEQGFSPASPRHKDSRASAPVLSFARRHTGVRAAEAALFYGRRRHFSITSGRCISAALQCRALLHRESSLRPNRGSRAWLENFSTLGNNQSTKSYVLVTITGISSLFFASERSLEMCELQEP